MAESLVDLILLAPEHSRVKCSQKRSLNSGMRFLREATLSRGSPILSTEEALCSERKALR
jgi:hypothetical protein